MTGIAIKRESEDMGHHGMGSYSSLARERRKVSTTFFCSFSEPFCQNVEDEHFNVLGGFCIQS